MPTKGHQYTQDDLESAIAAERERCAKLCEESNVFQYDDPGGFYARLIRAA